MLSNSALASPALQLARALVPALRIVSQAMACRALSTAAPAHREQNGTRAWWTVTPAERLVKPATTHDEEQDGVFESHHPSQRFSNVLSTLRSSYPEGVWRRVEDLFPERKRTHPVAIDIAVGAEGRAGVELARRGFHVIGIEADATLLARTFRFAQAHCAPIELVTAKVERSLLADSTADLVTFMHGLHLVDTQLALEEAHRLLASGGRLVAAWNDRDLSSEFACEMEELFERYNPHYNRSLKQRDIEQWGERLTQGGLFKLQEYSVHPNPLRMRNASALLDILDCMSFVRSALRGSERKAFNADARMAVESRFGREPFDLPLETKLYVLEKNDLTHASPHAPKPLRA